MISFDEIVPDIIKIIHNQLDFICQLNLKLTSTYFNTWEITNLLGNIPNRSKLTIKILESYPHIIKLDARHTKIFSISNLPNLQLLDISDNCAVCNDSLEKLSNLTELSISNNKYIINIDHMIHLHTLYASDFVESKQLHR